MTAGLQDSRIAGQTCSARHMQDNSKGAFMGERRLSDEDRVRELARLSGISIPEEEVSEVANRFGSLMLELDRLGEIDLADIQPVDVFPDEG